jgi:hypothetical protein
LCDIYEEAIQTVITVRDFTQVFDAYAQLRCVTGAADHELNHIELKTYAFLRLLRCVTGAADHELNHIELKTYAFLRLLRCVTGAADHELNHIELKTYAFLRLLRCLTGAADHEQGGVGGIQTRGRLGVSVV